MFSYARASERAGRAGKSQEAIALAQAAQRQRGVTPHVRALSALYEALGHARGGEQAACQNDLERADELVDRRCDGLTDRRLDRHLAATPRAPGVAEFRTAFEVAR
jgi:hypothetical protein